MADKISVVCDYCGITFSKLRNELHQHNFCCIGHLHKWNSERMSKFNRTENPTNTPAFWTAERRAEMGERNLQRQPYLQLGAKGIFWTAERRAESRRRNLGKGENRSYKKVYGKHQHRIAAEMKIRRALDPGEVVHHINGIKTDNRPENLEVMTRSQHTSMHTKEYWRKRKGGDANDIQQGK